MIFIEYRSPLGDLGVIQGFTRCTLPSAPCSFNNHFMAGEFYALAVEELDSILARFVGSMPADDT